MLVDQIILYNDLEMYQEAGKDIECQNHDKKKKLLMAYMQYDGRQIEMALHGHILTDCQKKHRSATATRSQTVQGV